MPGRIFVQGNSKYRYGFNGKENDNEVKGTGNQQDYGMRIYDGRLGRFLSVDALIKKYPELTPYQFASNCPISGIDLDGLEYYYASDGTLIAKWGTSTQVKLINDKFVQDNANAKKFAVKDLDANSVNVGMTNEELNIRAFMSTLKQTENGGNAPLPYNAANGFHKDGTPKTFTDKDEYNTSPRDFNKTGHTQSGAYQILKASWDDEHVGAEAYGLPKNNFSPAQQDKFIFLTIKYKKHAFPEVTGGDIHAAIKKLASEWRSLPGTKSQNKAITVATVDALFKKNVSNELQDKSDIATPKGGDLMKYEKGKTP